jgi:succinate dehydrogenase / fumarate reductase, cytochrome b subunit
MQVKSRPKYLNLFALAPHMSITAKISILHRITGVLLFLAIPFSMFLLEKSLTENSFYNAFYTAMSCPLAKVIYIVLIWAFVYHMVSGVRFLFLDVNKGTDIKKAKMTAKIVLVVSTLITIGLGVVIW